jgi:hypothetical protein
VKINKSNTTVGNANWMDGWMDGTAILGNKQQP